MSFLRTALAASISIGMLATSASADGLYYGVGIGVTDAESDPKSWTTNTSGATFGTLGGTLGYRWDKGGHFWGTEANLDFGLGADFDDDVTGLSCKTSANGPYYCSQTGTLRLRGLVGTEVGKGMELFGTLGLAAVSGDAADNPTTQDPAVNVGLTVGVGLQKQVGKNTHRIELIYDDLSSATTKPVDHPSVYSPEYKAVSLNYTLIFGRK